MQENQGQDVRMVKKISKRVKQINKKILQRKEKKNKIKNEEKGSFRERKKKQVKK